MKRLGTSIILIVVLILLVQVSFASNSDMEELMDEYLHYLNSGEKVVGWVLEDIALGTLKIEKEDKEYSDRDYCYNAFLNLLEKDYNELYKNHPFVAVLGDAYAAYLENEREKNTFNRNTLNNNWQYQEPWLYTPAIAIVSQNHLIHRIDGKKYIRINISNDDYKINLYDSNMTLIKEKISNNTLVELQDNIENFITIPVIAGVEVSEQSQNLTVFNTERDIDLLITFDPINDGKYEVNLVIDNVKAYKDVFGSLNGEAAIFNNIEYIEGLDKNNKSIDVKFIDELFNEAYMNKKITCDVNENVFPISISYVCDFRYQNMGYYHNRKSLSHTYEDMIYFSSLAVLPNRREVRTPYAVHFSVPEGWSSLGEYGNLGILLNNKNNMLTWINDFDQDSDDFYVAGALEEKAFEVLDGDYLFRYFTLKNLGAFNEQADEDSILKSVKLFEYFAKAIKLPTENHRAIFLFPNRKIVDDMGEYGEYTIHPWIDAPLESIDTHGIARMWFTGESLNMKGSAFIELIVNGLADASFNENYMFGLENPSYFLDIDKGTDQPSGGSIPQKIYRYINEVKGTKMDAPVIAYGDLNKYDLKGEEILKFRYQKIDLSSLLLEMIVYSETDGEIVEYLTIIKDMLNADYNLERKGTDADALAVLSQYTDYDFSDFFNKILNGTDSLNVAYSNSDKYQMVAMIDNYDKTLQIDQNNNEFSIKGYANQETWLMISNNYIVESLEVNKKEVDNVYYPWVSKGVYTIKVPKGNFEVTGKFDTFKTYPKYINYSSWAEASIIDLKYTNKFRNMIYSNLEDEITRGEFIYIAVKLYEILAGEIIDVDTNINFDDTDNIYARKGAAIGITSGVGNNNFGFNDKLNRQELAVFLMKVLKLADIQISNDDTDLFEDDLEISDWAKESIYLAKVNGIIGGVGNNRVDPKGKATREMALVIAKKMLDKYDN